MSLLFPFAALRNQFHIDHVFPVSRFTRSKLRKAGIVEENIDPYLDKVNQLPNLQLLEGAANNEKRAVMPSDWLDNLYSDAVSRRHYEDKHDLGEVPATLDGFDEFFESRRTKLRAKMVRLLSDATISSVAEEQIKESLS